MIKIKKDIKYYYNLGNKKSIICEIREYPEIVEDYDIFKDKKDYKILWFMPEYEVFWEEVKEGLLFSPFDRDWVSSEKYGVDFIDMFFKKKDESYEYGDSDYWDSGYKEIHPDALVAKNIPLPPKEKLDYEIKIENENKFREEILTKLIFLGQEEPFNKFRKNNKGDSIKEKWENFKLYDKEIDRKHSLFKKSDKYTSFVKNENLTKEDVNQIYQTIKNVFDEN